MLKGFLDFLGLKARHRVLTAPPSPRIFLADSVLFALRDCFAREIEQKHEGIAYLFGHTDGNKTIVLGAIRPEAKTTAGSFNVSAAAMARVVRKISDMGLQLVGQAHSHPGQAFHSEGDEIGARIAYQGFTSIVVPDYGTRLPDKTGWAVYFFREGRFSELGPKDVIVVQRSFT